MIFSANQKTIRNFPLCFLRVTPWLIFFILLASPVFSQNAADEIEILLETDAVTYGQAARFMLEAAGLQMTDPVQACQYAAEQKWLPKKVSADAVARLDNVALLVMRSFNLRGGLLYSLTKSPHFAYRELVYQDIIGNITDPAMPVSGEVLLYICSRVFMQTEEGN